MKNHLILIGLILSISLVTNVFAAPKNTIYIYQDEGVSDESLAQTFSTFKNQLKKYAVKTINAQKIKEGHWSKNAVLFVLPGGADLPYVKKLNGEGNKKIQEYVKNGGAFLGICAGGYYGSAYVEFDKNGPLEVLGPRELGFFQGKAIGPILAPYDYKTQRSSRAAKIHTILDTVPNTVVFYNGGGYFKHAEQAPNTKIIATYENHLPAIILIHYGRGKVLLSGVHIEYNPSQLNPRDKYIKKIITPLSQANLSRLTLFHNLMGMVGINSLISQE